MKVKCMKKELPSVVCMMMRFVCMVSFFIGFDSVHCRGISFRLRPLPRFYDPIISSSISSEMIHKIIVMNAALVAIDPVVVLLSLLFMV